MKGPHQAPIRALRKAPARAQPRFSFWAARLRDADVIDRALVDNAFDKAHEIVVTEVDDDDDRVHEAGVESRQQEWSDDDGAEE